MPIHNDVGTSTATKDKQEGFEVVISTLLSIVKQIFKNKGRGGYFYYIDACAGPGYNHNLGIPGSPILFIKTAEEIGIPCRAFFIEKNDENRKELENKIKDLGTLEYVNWETWNGDYGDVIPEILKTPENVPEWAYGLLYFDPTHLKDLKWDIIRDVYDEPCKYRKLDLLIHVSATMSKRVINSPTTAKYYNNIKNEMSGIRKEEKIIRDFVPYDNWHYTFIFGTNYANIKEWKKHRFFRINTLEGERIIAQATLAEPEFQKWKDEHFRFG